MNSVRDFTKAVDSLTGQVAFPLPLVTLPGPSALQVIVGLSYNSGVQQTVQGWNLSDPTGVAGLGWTLMRSAVAAAAPYGTDPGDAQMVLTLNGKAVTLIPSDGTTTYGQRWYATTEPGWQVSFASATQTWTVIDESGTRFTFGGLADESTGSVELAVDIGDWLASSNQAVPQTQFVKAWNLASITDLFGNACQFFYDVVTSTLGANGLAYAQASYLVGIEGAWGDKIALSYVEKQSYEYAYPYTNPPPPNAYQASVATRALDKVTLTAADGTAALVTAQLAYQTTFNAVDASNTAFNKRILTGVTLSFPGNYSLPALAFEYATTGENPGGLSKATTLPGAQVAYAYGQPGDATNRTLQYTDRALALSAPTASGVTFGVDDVLFEDSFTVVAWSGSDGSLAIAPYRWEGRWLAGTTTTVASAGSTQSASAPGLFAFAAAGKLYSYALDLRRPDSWIAGTTDLAAAAPAGTTGYQVAAGERFVAVLCQPSGTVLRVDFTEQSWNAAQTMATSLSAQSAYSLAAQGNKLLVAGVATSGVSLWVAVRGIDGVWTSSAVSTDDSPGTAPTVSAAFCVAGAGVLATGSLGGDKRYAGYACAFDGEGAAQSLTPLAQGGGDDPLFQTAGMTILVGPVVSRFDGRDWIAADLASLGMPADSTLGAVSVGPDIAARVVEVGGADARYDLVTFNANSGAWSVTSSNAVPATGVGVAVAPRMPRGSGRYAVLGNALYYMSSDQSWAAVSGVTLPTIAAGDAASVQVLGDDHLVYQTASAATTTAWFLGNGTRTASDTAAASSILASGKDASFLVGESAFITYTGTWNGADMALTLRQPVMRKIQGTQTAAVVASVGVTSGYASQAATVTVPGADAQSTIQLLGDALTNYTFTGTAATMSPDGVTPLFNAMTVLPTAPSGSASIGRQVLYQFNGLCAPEVPLRTPPAGAAELVNTADNASIVTGLAYIVVAQDSAGTQAALTENYWYATVTAETAGAIAYARLQRSVNTVDLVLTTVDWRYLADTGQLKTTTTSYVDETGATVATTLTNTYFWQEYDNERDLNILSPVVQVLTSATVTPSGGSAGAAQPTAGTATTWRQDWGNGVTGWAPFATFRQNDASATGFGAWVAGTTPTTGWERIGQITMRIAGGVATGAIDVNSVPTTMLADRRGRFLYGGATGSGDASLSYYGCEPYEPANGWQVLSGGALSAHLTTSDAHTGTTSLMLSGGTNPDEFVNFFQPSDLGRQYVFGCWARSPQGYDASGTATATITALWTDADGDQEAALAELTLSSSTMSNWLYVQSLLDIPGALDGSEPIAGSFVCKVLLSNDNTGTANTVLVDELRLSPMSATFSAATMDTTRWLQTSTIDNNGQSVQAVYDGWLQPIAAIGPDAQIIGASITGLSRLLPGTGGAFNPFWPNSNVALTPGGKTQYDDFHDDTSALWNFTAAGGTWSIGGGKLSYSGTAAAGAVLGATARPKDSNTASFAARIVVKPGAGASPSLGDGTIFLHWDATAESYALVSAAADGTLTTLQSPSATVALGTDWLFVAVDGFYLCAVNGVFLFSYIRAAGAPSGAGLTLASNGSCEFDDLIRMDDPGVTLAAFDAMARPTQTIGVIGGAVSGSTNTISVQVATTLYDSFSRPVIGGMPLTASLVLSTASGGLTTSGTVQTLPDESPTQYLVAAQSGAAAVTTYVQTGLAIAGMPTTQLTYSWTVGEATPLSRPLNALPARATTASNGSGYERDWSYTGLAALPTAPPAAEGAPPVYRQSRLTAQTALKSGVPVTTLTTEIRAQDGRILQQLVGTADAPTQTARSVTYKPSGLVATRLQANAADPPTDTEAQTWIESFDYDFLGRPETWTSSDRGETNYVYDNADRLRFLQDSNGAAASPPRIAYNRYDALGRVVEQGWIDDPGYAWGSPALADEIDNQSFPHVPGGTGSGSLVDGRWRNQLTYDTDGKAETLYLLGRLAQALSQPDSGSDGTTTTYSYDSYGQITAVGQTVTLDGASTKAATGYGYDSAGRVASIVYPALDADAPSVGYYYDRLGRLGGVGTVVDGGAVVDPTQPVPQVEVRYAGYQYGALSELTAVGLNRAAGASTPAITRTLSYASPARLTDIDDAYLSLDFGYTDLGGAVYTIPRIASANATYQVSQNWTTPPTPFGFAFGYDAQGRLTAATPSTPSTVAFGFAAPGDDAYDANGNRRAWSRGVTGYSATYPVDPDDDDDPQPGDPGVPANGIETLVPSISGSVSFANASGSTAGAWAWGSSNGGPSTSSLQGSTGAKYLKLGGGNALGHYEVLVLDTWLDPSASLQMTATTGTDLGYPTSGNQAAWTLTLFGPSGAVAETTLQYVPPGSGEGNWASQTVPVDVADAIAKSGYDGEVTRARLALQNMTRGASDGAAGAAVYVQELKLSWPAPPDWQFGYDPDGSVVEDPQLGLGTIDYDYLSSQATSVVRGTTVQDWLRNSAGQAVASTLESADDDVVALNHFDLSGRLIAQSLTQDDVTTVQYFVNGIGGPVAVQQEAALSFILDDQIGSIRAVIDGDKGKAQASFDYQPFGGLARSSGALPWLARFTSHWPDNAIALMPTPARLMDPGGGRFLQVDPRYDGLSPYSYAINDPANLVDPTGEFWQGVAALAVIDGFNNVRQNSRPEDSWLQTGGYFVAGASVGFLGSGTSIGYVLPFSIATGTHFLLAGVVQSAAAGGLRGVALDWLNAAIRGEPDERSLWSSFSNGALTNGAWAAGVGIVGTGVGAWMQANGQIPNSAEGWYDPSQLYRAFYEPSKSYSVFSKRLSDVLKKTIFLHPTDKRWFELEHTWPQRWTKTGAWNAMRVVTNAPVFLIPVFPWINTPVLEGRHPLWDFVLPFKQTIRREIIRPFYAIPVTAALGLGAASLVVGVAAGAYGLYQRGLPFPAQQGAPDGTSAEF